MVQPAHDSATYEDSFQEHRSFLWSVLYRLTGCAADADDLVQDTFVRAMERPPGDVTGSLRPWLLRVGLNLGRDLLRRRRRAAYVGPWLPSPVPTGDDETLGALEIVTAGVSTEGRYDLLESVSMAFLTALEVLTPQQRAVLLLRDVFDYSVSETAAALGTREGAVKMCHLRARRAMTTSYERERRIPTNQVREQARQLVWKLMQGLAGADVEAIETLLTEDARSLSDGGGEFHAALNPVVGARNVARLYLGLFRKFSRPSDYSIRNYNGVPALVVTLQSPPRHERLTQRFLIQVEPAADGRIRRLYSVLASRKLTRVVFAR